MVISYGTYTITEVQEGSQIWTTTVAPVSPDYTFTVSNLTGDSNTSVKVGDIIMYSYYRYTVLSISSDGTTVLTGNRVSIRGTTGAASVTYTLIVSNLAIIKDKNGNISPTTITLTAKSQTGSSAMTNYAGRFKIETTINNSTWTTQYTSSANEATKNWTVINDIIAVRCSLYLKDGTTTLLDQQTIPIVSDGIDGADGNDAYSIILTNENHTFAGNTTSALESEIECNVIAYKGATQVVSTIGTITGQPTGMTTTLLNNGTINTAFKVNVTASMVTKNGVLIIPITVDGKTFTKEFTYALTLDGEDGKDGGRWYSGTKITGTSTTATIFADSGITSAVIGDMYLNTSTYNTYRCTVGGNASAAKWIYVNNIKGTTGKGISSITNQYYLSTSDTTQSDGSWSDTPQTYVEGRYYWTRSHIVWDDGGSPTDTTPVLDNALTDANANAIDAKKVATNYLSIDNTGIMVANMKDGEQKPSEATGRNVFIDNDSIDIRNGTLTLASFTGDNTKFYDPVYKKELATFGTSGAIIGAINEQRFIIEKDSVSAINENGAPVFSIVSTNKTFKTEAEAAPAGQVGAFIYGSTITLDAGDSVSENTFYIKNISAIVCIDHSSSILNNVKVNSVNASATRIDYYDGRDYYIPPHSKHSIVIPESPAFSCNYGVSKTVTYEITANFTNDYNDSYNLTCNFTLTYDGQRTLTFSVFKGSCTRTSGNNENQARFDGLGSMYTYSPIISSTAYTKAPAMTFGTRNGEDGMLSSVFGQGLYAEKDGEFVIGRFNEQELQTESKYAFIVGNGETEEHRSNALTIDWSGNICFGVDVAGLDVDAELVTAIENAGWDDDVYDD